MMQPPMQWGIQGGLPKQSNLLWPFIYQLITTAYRVHTRDAHFNVTPSLLGLLQRKDIGIYLNALWPDQFPDSGRHLLSRQKEKVSFGPGSTGYFVKNGSKVYFDSEIFSRSGMQDSNSPKIGFKMRAEHALGEIAHRVLHNAGGVREDAIASFQYDVSVLLYELLDNSLRWAPFNIKPTLDTSMVASFDPSPFITTCHFAMHRNVRAVTYLNVSKSLFDYLYECETENGSRPPAYMQISFIDNGIGIPCRHLAQHSSDITISSSIESIQSSLNVGSKAGRMYSKSKGYARILNSLKDRKGCLLIATGKTVAIWNGVDNQNEDERLHHLFQDTNLKHYYLSGCAVSALFPIFDEVHQ
jgi:hypothetical protein